MTHEAPATPWAAPVLRVVLCQTRRRRKMVRPLGTEEVPLADAANRTLAAPITASRLQPPFAASAMDGYALNGVEADPEAMFRVIGESAAGHGFHGHVGPGECVAFALAAPDRGGHAPHPAPMP